MYRQLKCKYNLVILSVIVKKGNNPNVKNEE